MDKARSSFFNQMGQRMNISGAYAVVSLWQGRVDAARCSVHLRSASGPSRRSTPSPDAQSPGSTERSGGRSELTACMAGRYTPMISKMVEPEIPAKQIVQGVQKAVIEAEDECNGTADTLSASAIQKPWNPVNTRHTPKNKNISCNGQRHCRRCF